MAAELTVQTTAATHRRQQQPASRPLSHRITSEQEGLSDDAVAAAARTAGFEAVKNGAERGIARILGVIPAEGG